MSSFGYHVPHVVSMGTLKKMRGITTRWVVTTMKNKLPLNQGAVLELKDKPMGIDQYSTSPQNPISGIHAGFHIGPTSVISTRTVNVFPQSLLDGLDRAIADTTGFGTKSRLTHLQKIRLGLKSLATLFAIFINEIFWCVCHASNLTTYNDIFKGLAR
jgi:hypothetical protein